MLNKINKCLLYVFCFISILFAVLNKEAILLLFCLYTIIPFVLKFKNIIAFLYLTYGFIALFLGCQLHFYKTLFWFDNLAHFIWGGLSSLLAILILKKFKKHDNLIFNCIFIFVFSLASSGLWEIIEFTIDNLFNTDMQRSATGIYDTMKDITIALFGNILFILSYVYEDKNRGFLIKYMIDNL